MTGTNFSNWFNASEGTLFAQGIQQAPRAAGTANVIAEIGTGNATNIFEMTGYGDGRSGVYVSSGGSQQALIITNGGFPINSVGKTMAVYKVNDFILASNGILGPSDSSGLVMSSPNTFYIGRYGGNSNYWNGIVQKISYWPQRLTNAELQAFSK